ncbi:MAG: hypothetical protein ACRET2_11375 [Steroidobacteraceae bacterium]
MQGHDEPALDRLAKRLAAHDASRGAGAPADGAHVSRRRLLAGGVALAVAGFLPRLRFPAVAVAAGVTSCSCADYAGNRFANCYDTYLPLAGPSNGAALGMLYAGANYLANQNCNPQYEQDQNDCTEVPCPPGQTCTSHYSRLPNGRPTLTTPTCKGPCPSGQTKCNGQCVDLESDTNNCGSCGNVCVSPSNCQNGQCQLVCEACGSGHQSPGMQVCVVGGAAQCVDTWTDPDNCGGCGNVCPDSVNGFRSLCNCGQCDGCAGGVTSLRCCPSNTCAHACPSPGESCP